jgi:hypothetical protein
MPQYKVEALRTIRVLQRTHERAEHEAQAEQMRRVGDQVALLVECAEMVLNSSPFEMPSALKAKARQALGRDA